MATFAGKAKTPAGIVITVSLPGFGRFLLPLALAQATLIEVKLL